MRSKTKEYRKVYEKQLRETNPEYAERQRENSRQWGKDFPEKLSFSRWATHIKRKYNMTPDQYYTMLENQGGGCKLCDRKSSKNRLPVDHEHTTGRIRGILCTPCNRAVGILEKNIDKLVDYLRAQ